jgi:hypothetical protein
MAMHTARHSHIQAHAGVYGISRAVVATMVVLLQGCTPPAEAVRGASPAPQAMLFTRAELLQDVDYIFATIHGVHPNAYHRADSTAVVRARHGLENTLHDGMSAIDFWRVTAPVIALLRDGHTSLSRPVPDVNPRAGLPLVVRLDSAGATVRTDLSDEQRLPPGTRLLLVNRVPIAVLIAEVMATLPFERDAMRLWVVERTLSEMIPLLRGWTGPYEVLAELLSGDTLAAVLPPMSQEDRSRRLQAAGLVAAPAPPYSFEMLAGGRLGYIDLRLQMDVRRFRRFLNETFAHLQQDPPCALVIDLRRNPGGSGELGDLLMAYLTDRPIRQFSRVEVRASAQVKARYRQRLPRPIRWLPARLLGIGDRRFGALLASPDGAIVTWTDEEKAPGHNRLRWEGPVFALTGVNTFSSGADLAAALQDYGLATVVGEETGGLSSSYGESYASRLPHTGLRLSVSSKNFARPSGIEDGRGVVPDLFVPAGELEPGVDAAMQRVLEQAGACARHPNGGQTGARSPQVDP